VESKGKNVEGYNLKVRGGGVSMHFTPFFALSQRHIPVVLFKLGKMFGT